MSTEVFVVGSSWRNVPEDTDLQLDELVFEAVSGALRSAGITRHQVGMSIISSLDLYDGRSISNALTAPAAAGYLGEELRVEGDVMAATYVALAALMANQADVAVITGLHIPEIATSEERRLTRFREQVSNYTFDAHIDRPVGMSSEVTLGMHAASRLESGRADLSEMASRTAADISRGSTRRGVRSAVSASDVASAPTVVAPLTELMLPAASTGVGALVLAADVVARRSLHPTTRIAGWGLSTAPRSSSPGWLDDPAAATRRAAEQAYAQAGIANPAEQIDILEMTDLTPALTPELLSALAFDEAGSDRVNPSGGVRANFPGIANGALRLIEAVEAISDDGGRNGGKRWSVAHSMDDLSGLVTSTASVLVLEEV
jgi:hypothetical protein